MLPLPVANLVRTFCLRSWVAATLALPLLSSRPSSGLYMPRAVAMAYARGTRSSDGRPGAAYWQNHGRYTIAIAVAPPDRTLRGTEQIVYSNNSPDTLRVLSFKLFLNIHKPGAPRDGGAGEDYLTSGVHIDTFTVRGQSMPWDDKNVFTNRMVRLAAPLLPHDSIPLSFAWHVDLSKQSGREGMLNPTSAFLAYFYPRVAVYDDYNGWDQMDFTDQQEFYSDFNDYDVSIRAPANFVVWGTGTLLNSTELLTPEVERRYQASLASDTTIHIATRDDFAAHRVTASAPFNTWNFRAINVPDVAFAVSDHFDWDGASVIVDDAAHRRAGVQAAYDNSSADYHHMVEFGRGALDWLSHHWPGVPYPYEKTTIVQGFADMEYPMMVNDNTNPDTSFSRFVVEHEIAHTWFPFYMGINETRYGFMDEGWATTFEYLINQKMMGPARAQQLYKQFRVAGWIHDPSPLEDLPIITPEDVLKNQAYGNNAYGKASLGYLAVKDLLGDDFFGRSLREFIARWHGKHPIPWDFFNTVNNVSGKDLNWFWQRWYFDNSYIDLAVATPVRRASGYAVTVRNIGGMPAPFDLVIAYTDGTGETIHHTPAFWQPNPSQGVATIATRKTIKSITLDGGIWMDANTKDNSWTASATAK